MLNLKNLLTVILTKLCRPSGFTMEGELKLASGKVAAGSGQIQASNTVNMTMSTFIANVRMTSGCVGSFYLESAYSYTGSGYSLTVPAGWYNYMYIPHRSGAQNGQANGDNHNYGNVMMKGMNNSANVDTYIIRINNTNIGDIVKVQNDDAMRASTSTITTKNNTTYYENYQTIVTQRGKVVTVSFEVRTISVAKWPNVYPVTGLPATYGGLEVYGSLVGPSGQSVAVAIQSNGSVKMSGGVNGVTCYGTVTYIAA